MATHSITDHPVQASSAAGALDIAARYDCLRLRTYREAENLHHRIQIGSIGSALALRFDDVGYFNRVYAADATIFDRLSEVEDFYRGCPFGCEIVSPGDANSTTRAFGSGLPWTRGRSYAWVHARMFPEMAWNGASDFEIRPPQPDERTAFLECYLRAFEASPANIPAALSNMRHLFLLPELRFLLAWKDDRPVGVGMTYQAGDGIFLCAGAALPKYREQGCHTALLAARIRLAAGLGCRDLFSWAAEGSQSHENLQRAGLSTVGVTSALRLSPDRVR